MKNTIRVLGFIAIIAVIGFTFGACVSTPFGEEINSVEGLKEYLESQPANSPDTPIKITLKIDASMLNGIADTLRSTDKYVSLQLRGVSTIPDSAFRDCKSLIIMDFFRYDVSRIGNDAFRGCTNLTSLRRLYNLREFSHTAFDDCPSLIEIDAWRTTKPALFSYQGVLCDTDDNDRRRLIFCPQGKTGAYTVPDDVESIAPYAFYGSKLTSITMNGGNMEYLTIGDNAFTNCSNLTSVTIYGNVRFSDNAFEGNLLEVYNAGTIISVGRQMAIIEFDGTFTREIGSNRWTKR
ncbi:MAG: leucine-rich repeat domain-containing protein [Treponema sp.]|jgi:hypothetical protein|nr:leucine-rich repeat domain-containing protein [Treponema sp.]